VSQNGKNCLVVPGDGAARYSVKGNVHVFKPECRRNDSAMSRRTTPSVLRRPSGDSQLVLPGWVDNGYGRRARKTIGGRRTAPATVEQITTRAVFSSRKSTAETCNSSPQKMKTKRKQWQIVFVTSRPRETQALLLLVLQLGGK